MEEEEIWIWLCNLQNDSLTARRVKKVNAASLYQAAVKNSKGEKEMYVS